MYKDIEIIKSEIKYLLEALHEQFESIDAQGDTIMQIDVDLFKNFVVNLYDATRHLKNFNIKEEKPTPRIETPAPISTPKTEEEIQPIRFSIIQKNKVEEISIPPIQAEPEPISEPQIEVQAEVKPIISPEPLTEPIPSIPQQVEVPVEIPVPPKVAEIIPPESKPEPQPVIKAEPLKEKPILKTEVEQIKPKTSKTTLDLFADDSHTLADKFKSEKKALNELHHIEQKNLAGKIPLKPINDLKQAIGINEKFNFINELFKGSLQDYNLAINDLNSAPDWDSAQNILNTFMLKFGWVESNEAFPKLSEMVRRKFL